MRIVGKDIGGCLYVEASYDYTLPDKIQKLVELFNSKNPKFDYRVIKWNRKDGSVSFIESPDFDTADEPTVASSIKMYSDGSCSQKGKIPMCTTTNGGLLVIATKVLI